MALINSSSDPYFQNVLVAHHNRTQARQNQEERLGPVDALGVQRNPDTLAEHIRGEKWPRKHQFRQFTTNKNLLELQLTENDEFVHTMEKSNTKKTHLRVKKMSLMMKTTSSTKKRRLIRERLW